MVSWYLESMSTDHYSRYLLIIPTKIAIEMQLKECTDKQFWERVGGFSFNNI
jgi:hypothetical protein